MAIVPPGATTIYVGGQNGVDADGLARRRGQRGRAVCPRPGEREDSARRRRSDPRRRAHWTVLFVDGVDSAAGYKAIASELTSDEPALVTAARVAGLGVPGALVEISAIAAVLR
ncbi:RidA family protein [Pengzhenrongella sicca]